MRTVSWPVPLWGFGSLRRDQCRCPLTRAVFFIHSSGVSEVSANGLFGLAILYLASRSWPLYITVKLMFPFCAISAKYATGSISRLLPSAATCTTLRWRCGPVVRVPVLPDTAIYCPASTVSPPFRCRYDTCVLLPSSRAYSTVTDLPPTVLGLSFTATTSRCSPWRTAPRCRTVCQCPCASAASSCPWEPTAYQKAR